MQTHQIASQFSTGLEMLTKAMRAGGLGVGIGQTLGLSISGVADGLVAITGIPGPEHANPMGAVHGGYLATMLDAAMGLALFTRLDVHARYATIDLNVTYLKGVKPGSGSYTATGTIIHLTRSTALTEARVTDEKAQLYAHATATFSLAPPKEKSDSADR